ncbi:nuclear body protein SP140-like protein isoform X2 [Hemibagrus wyckioides]|nr:nuclear body protein SP140-like protein isoform X2 [Hemibagrus wyckioides]XP_058260965.1 nuclear body protein SP140-like protein isoform X2 [Hemibagrus wyckioides]
MSCLEEPQILLSQLRDHYLVPEDLYKKVTKAKTKKTKQKVMYEILDWVENERRQCMKLFWSCVFQDHILQHYPVFHLYQTSLLNGSFRKSVKDGEREGKEQAQKEGATKRKRGDEEIKEEEPGPSSGSRQKKAAKERTFSSLLKGGQLPVTCGEKTGILYPDKLAKESVSSGDTDESDDDLEEYLIEKDQEEEDQEEEEEEEEEEDCGSHSKSIRTEEHWFTPEEFVKQEFVKQELTDGHWEKDQLCHGKTLNYLVKEQDNDDVCYICNSEGRLVCCDECPRAFHHHCHLPVLQEDALGGSWICTYCVLKHNMKLWIHMNRKGALRCPVSSNLMRCEYLLLFLFKADTQRVLTDDPTKKVDRYAKVISKPMWLNKVKTKLQNKEYRTVGQFVRDIRLIFNNCQTFYRDNRSVRMGAKLKKLFEKEFNRIFKIL